MQRPRVSVLAGALGLSALAGSGSASEAPLPEPLSIRRAAGPITVDGDLRDEGWKGAVPVATWYEVNPGDNTPPAVKNVAYLAYDDRFFYAAFEFEDPSPAAIRAPYADRDNISGDTDYGGVILDTRNDGKTAIEFLANPRGVQYDAVQDDASGNEDPSPDYFWDAAGRITASGWTLEIRIPFSSLRYPRTDPAVWGILLYRNYPRAYRYQFFSTRLPRGGQCLVCRENKLAGLESLPAAGHLTLAPYLSASRAALPEGGVLGDPLRGETDRNLGGDAKWTPSASTAVDATFKPDFSQIESDVAQISANERFALFYPEKRPFFLEDVELFSTPIQAVYTRTLTAPAWGARATGKIDSTAYTALFAQDRGGGQAILPGSNSSELADQDFRSIVGIARLRHDLGRSSVGALFTDREIAGGGSNRVFGPDGQWRIGETDTLTAQVLLSNSATPARPDLADEWDGRRLSGHAVDAWWLHTTSQLDLYTEARSLSGGFRADDGFVPQVGYRNANGEYGYTLRPQGLLRRLRPFLNFDYSEDDAGRVLERQYSLGFGLDGRWNTSARFRYAFDHVRSGDRVLPQQQLLFSIYTAPSRLLTGISLQGSIGQQIDFANDRTGSGPKLALQFTVRPTDHLELRVNEARRWVAVDAPGRGRARVFTAKVDRLRATYNFSPRVFLRTIAQCVETRRDPSLYSETVGPRDAFLGLSALFAYKLNWQTVLFLGYGDGRALDEAEVLRKADRQLFLKVSYALQM